VAGERLGAPEVDQDRVADELARRTVRGAVVDLLDANAAAARQLTQCRPASTSFASAQVRTNDEGRVWGLNTQLTTTVLAAGVR